MLSVVCFSKDRPLQLEAYLDSLRHFSAVPVSAITVLYMDSEEVRYDSLISRNPGINWRRESRFRDDLLQIVSSAQNYILFGCDDVFFTDHFDPAVALGHLARDPGLFGFSLRLGLNLHSLPAVESDGEVLTWNWAAASEGNWSYPWDVSASIYRKAFVLDYLSRSEDATNPNRLESILARQCSAGSVLVGERLACYVRSKCLTLTVNRVQDEFPNEYDDSAETDLTALYKAFIGGRHLDWARFEGAKNSSIHVDSRYFTLCDNVQPRPVTLAKVATSHSHGQVDLRRLRLRVFFWRYMTSIKEKVRPHVPRRLMPLLRRLLRLQ